MSIRTRPCDSCPFTDENQLWLGEARKREIADSILGDASFHCHKTLDYDTEDGHGATTDNTQECAGAMILLDREEMPNQMMRILARLGMLDLDDLDHGLVPYESLDAWVEGVVS